MVIGTSTLNTRMRALNLQVVGIGCDGLHSVIPTLDQANKNQPEQGIIKH